MPKALAGLGLPSAVLRSHRGWDPGALPIARALGREFDVPLFAGRWSRLVADLNRSEDHARVIAPRIDGRWVPGNRDLSPEQRQARLDRYWRPHRREVAAAVAAAVRAGDCLHLMIHSFVERLRGVERTNDVGILFDPHRPRERAFATALRAELVARDLSVRFNFPYFGNTDGLPRTLRALHPPARYRGFELEFNQRLARTAAGQRRLVHAVVPAVVAAARADHG